MSFLLMKIILNVVEDFRQDLINQNIDTACLEVYEPVCGCDIRTYSNECYARKAGVTSYVDGECN